MEPAPGVLRQFSLLAPLDEATLETLCTQLRSMRLERNSEVIRIGETSSSLYFVVDGRLKVVAHSASGREIGLAWLGPQDWFGEMALVDREPRSASVITATQTVLLALPAAAARTHLLREPDVVQLLLQRLAQMVRQDNERRTLLSTGNAFQRVCGFLLSLCPADEPGARWPLERTLTHEAIASMTDTSRETVSRTIALLRERGVAEKQGQTHFIVDPQALRRIASTGLQKET